ncbi:MAG: molybdopterin adenylyltransferase [Dehalococcoidales bacterium]|nr:molybdopterin adenylyltransferase [Dehalococcoidales bacterium]
MFKTGVLTISDKGSKGQREDKSGPVIRESVAMMNGRVVKYEIVPDNKETIAAKLCDWADGGELDIVLTTGGTGLAERDITPEATLSVVDREVPGIAEAMRIKSLDKTPTAMLSRAVAGQRGRCLIINLPGSPKAVKECLEVIMPALPHAVEIIRGEVTEHSLQDAGIQ